MPASRPSRTELRRAPAPIRSRHSPIPPGAKAGKRRAIGQGPKQLVGPKRRPVAGSQGLRLLRGIRLPAPQAGSQSVQASETDKDLRGTARCRIRCDRGLRVCRLTEDRWRNRARAFGRPSGPRTAWFAFCSPRPADVREGTSCRLHAHFPKCRHRPDPAAFHETGSTPARRAGRKR